MFVADVKCLQIAGHMAYCSKSETQSLPLQKYSKFVSSWIGF